MSLLLTLPLLFQAVGAPTPPAPLRQIAVDLSGASVPSRVLLAGLDVIFRAPGTERFELLCDDTELERLSELGLAYTVIHADTGAFYADRLARASAAEPPALGAWLSPPFGQGSIGGFYSWTEVAGVLDQIASAYPNIVRPKVSLGQSIEGRDLWALAISDNPGRDESEPEVRFDALHHAREPGSMQTVLWTLLYLVENYGTAADATWLVDNRKIWFVPVVNPDGYVFNQTTHPGGGGLWRQNRRDNGDGTIGVELNRNYPFKWGLDNLGSSGLTASSFYRGTAPASEPEVAAMVAFMSARSFVTALSCHTYSDLWMYPFAYTTDPSPAQAGLADISTRATAVNDYQHGQASHLLYEANGVTIDHDHGVHGTYAWTPEIGGPADGFYPPQSRIVPLAEENLHAFLQTAFCAGANAYIAAEVRNDLGDGDGFFEPGESLGLTITAHNSGAAASATPVVVTLVSTHTHLEVAGAATHDFGLLAPFSDGVSTPRVLSIAPTAQPGTLLTYDTVLTFEGYTETIASTLLVGQPRPYLTDDLEVDLGWSAGLTTDTALTGRWEYGDPVGTFSDGEPSNPEDDATPGIDKLSCFATGNGAADVGGDDVDGGLTTLITPAIDLSGVDCAVLGYARWFADFINTDDALQVAISDDDGFSWIALETVTSLQNEWTRVSFVLADFIQLTDVVRVRFVVADDPNNSYVEAAVDDLVVDIYDSGARFHVYGRPTIGTSVALHVAGPPGGLYGVVQSRGTGFHTFPLIAGPLLLDPTDLIAIASGALPPNGLGRQVVPIPNLPALIDVTLYYQAIVSGPGGFELTDRDEITFQ